MMHSLDLLLLFYQEKRRSHSAAVSRGKPKRGKQPPVKLYFPK
ncbi:hypothetical protein ACFOG5_05975 [Pedobacter fastidiosus]